METAASIVEYTVRPEHAETIRDRVREHLLPVARRSRGYRGFLLLDRGEGKRLAVLLFDSEADVRAAQQTLGPIGREHTYSLMEGPALGSVGSVVLSDGVFAVAAAP